MSQSTKETIKNAFYSVVKRKQFEKITVRDIVEECGINRKTFYYYFKDIYDLLEYGVRTDLEKYVSSNPENLSLEESVMGILEHIENNRSVANHINFQNNSELRRYLYNPVYETVFKKYKNKSAEFGVSERDFGLICEILVMTFLSMMSVWLDGGMKPEYKEDIRRVCVMFGNSADTMFESINKTTESERKQR